MLLKGFLRYGAFLALVRVIEAVNELLSTALEIWRDDLNCAFHLPNKAT
jgi:hypothetical protein